MKKLFSPSVLMFSFGIIALGFSFASFSLADVGDLNEAINPGENPPIALAGIEREAYNPTCLDNWRDWPTSEEFNSDAEWNLSWLPVAPRANQDELNKVTRQLIDINGDGLQDYIYSNRSTDGYTNLSEDCVVLNTGRGWDIAYQCVIIRQPDQGWPVYYGDCALVE